jgi:tetratricopeptide (TPR) repeat protein
MPGGSQRVRPAAGKKPAGGGPGSPGQKRFEPWQLVAGFALVVLIAFFVYTEVSREQPRAMTTPAPPSLVAPSPAVTDLSPLEQAVAASPRDPAALLNLANGLHDNRAFARAADTYRKYLALVPDNPDARVDLGICCFELARMDTVNPAPLYTSAIREMESVLKQTPDHQPAAFNLGVVNLAMGNLQQSNAWFRKAVEINKNSDLGAKAQRMLDQHSQIQ